MENRDEETFRFTYSAKEQQEVREIRKKYVPSEEQEDKMVQLRRLDDGVTRKATVMSLVIGIVGTLILGFGMSLAMTELSDILGMSSGVAMFLGIVIGVIGIILICLAYPVYNRIVKKERQRIAPEIIRLTDELMK